MKRSASLDPRTLERSGVEKNFRAPLSFGLCAFEGETLDAEVSQVSSCHVQLWHHSLVGCA